MIEWIHQNNDPWRRFGLIVTADCDLAQEKHEGILSYVPIFDLPDYLRLFYFPRRLRTERAKAADQALAVMRRLQSELRPDFAEPVSEDAVEQMLHRSPTQVADALRTSGDQRSHLIRLISAIQECDHALDTLSHDGALEAFASTRVALGGEKEKALNDLMRDVQQLLRSLPGDGLFLGSLNADHATGYVAYLRVIRETSEATIALRPAQLELEHVESKRIGRLSSPYIFHLTQRLASVFTAIGLPTEYEEHRAAVVAEQYASGS